MKELILQVPNTESEYTIIKYPFSGTYLMEKNSKDFNAWKTKIGLKENELAEIVGFVDSSKGNFKINIKKQTAKNGN
jgi:hypothetical protein